MADENEQEQEHEEEIPGGESDVVTINPQIFEAADTLPKTVSDDEKAYFVAAADFFSRELITNLAEAFPEILRIADKNGDNGQKSKTSNVAVALKIDVTNTQMLAVGLNLSVAPWKLNLKAEAEEDLRQLHLDFAARSATKTQTPDTGEPHETAPRGGPEGDLFSGCGDEVHGDGTGHGLPLAEQGAGPGDSQHEPRIDEGGVGVPVEKKERKRYTREELEALAADEGKKSLESVLDELVSFGAELKFAKRDTLAEMVQKIMDAQDVLNQRDAAATE